jgi:hypothetical protein
LIDDELFVFCGGGLVAEKLRKNCALASQKLRTFAHLLPM